MKLGGQRPQVVPGSKMWVQLVEVLLPVAMVRLSIGCPPFYLTGDRRDPYLVANVSLYSIWLKGQKHTASNPMP